MHLKLYEFKKNIIDLYMPILKSIYASNHVLPNSLDAYNTAIGLVNQAPIPYEIKKKNLVCMIVTAYAVVTGFIVKVHPIVPALIGEVALRCRHPEYPIEYYLQGIECKIPASAKDRNNAGPTLLSAERSQLRLNIQYPSVTAPVVQSSKNGFFLAYVEGERFAVLSKEVLGTVGKITKLTADEEGIKAEGSVLIRKACDHVLLNHGLLRDDFVIV